MHHPWTRTERIAFLALLVGGSAIGFAPIFVRYSPVGPTATGFWRMLIALPAFLLIARHQTHPPLKPGATHPPRWAFFIPGVFFAGDMALWNNSLHWTTVSNATLLTNLAPIFVTLAAWFLFKERVTVKFIVGLVLALAGATLLMGASFQLSRENLFGDLLGFTSAVFYGGYQLSVNRLRRYMSTAGLMTHVGLSSSIVLAVLTPVMGESFLWSGPGFYAGLAALLGLGLLSHVGGQGPIAYALAHLPAALSSVSLLIQPVVASIAAYFLFRESLSPGQLAGGAIVLAGIYLARLGSIREGASIEQEEERTD